MTATRVFRLFSDLYDAPSAVAGSLLRWSASGTLENVTQATILTAPPAQPLVLTGSPSDGATAVGTILDTTSALTIPGSKLLSLRDAGTEKAYFSKDGSLYIVNGSAIGASVFHSSGGYFGTFGANAVTVKGNSADGASALGVVLDTVNAFSTAGSKLLSVRNAGSEKAYVDKDGIGNFYGVKSTSYDAVLNGQAVLRGFVADSASAVAVKVTSYNSLATAGAKILSLYSDNGSTERAYVRADGAIAADRFMPYTAGPSILLGNPTDGATAIANKLMCGNALSNGTAKILSLYSDLGATERAYVRADGLGYFAAGVQSGLNVFASSYLPNGNTAAVLKGTAVDSAAATGVVLDNSNALTTAGARTVSFRSAGSEKAYVDYQGKGVFYGGILSSSDAFFSGRLDASANRWWSELTLADTLSIAWNSDLPQDHLQFNAPNTCEALINGVWVSQTVPTGIFAAQKFGTFNIVSAGVANSSSFDPAQRMTQVRFTWNNITYKWFDLFYIQASANSHTFTVECQTSADGVTWNSQFITGSFSSWPGHGTYRKYFSNSGQTWHRYIITPTYSTGQYAANNVQINTMRHFGGYPTTAAIKLFDWDYLRNLTVYAGIINGASNAQIIKGSMADSSSAVGVVLDNTVSLATAGAKLLSIRNAASEKAYVDYTGLGYFTGGAQSPAGAYFSSFSGYGANPTYLRGMIADGATAIGAKIGNVNALTTAGSKIVSLYSDNATTERAFVDAGTGSYVNTGVLWDDIQGPAMQGTGASALTQEVYRDTPVMMAFFRSGQSDSLSFNYQMPHRWKANTEVRVHIHVIPMADPATTQNVRFQCTYAWVTFNASLGLVATWTTVTVNKTITNGDAFKEVAVPLFSTTPTGMKESSFLIVNVKRLGADVNDTYNTTKTGGTPLANLAVLNVDAHIQVEKQGTIPEY